MHYGTDGEQGDLALAGSVLTAGVTEPVHQRGKWTLDAAQELARAISAVA
jgi:hypothetical protein